MSNPIWENIKFSVKASEEQKRSMSLNRVITKTTLCYILLLLATVFMWTRHFSGKGDLIITVAALLAGFATTYISFRIPEINPLSVPVHAVIEGLAVGGVSVFIEILYPGLALNAVLLTFSAALVVIAAYRWKILINMNRIVKVVIATISSIGVYYVITFMLRIFSINVFRFISPLAMGICFVLTALASFNLVRDFEFIEDQVRTRTKTRMEWMAVLGLLVTMGWIYLEFFRLVNIIKSFIGEKTRKSKRNLSESKENGGKEE